MPTSSAPPSATRDSASERVQRQIVQVSGGDLSTGQMLRRMLWHAYQSANCPFGSSEEGMFIWWEHEQHTQRT